MVHAIAWRLQLALFLACTAGFSVRVEGQAALAGVVVDATGASIPGAQVIATLDNNGAVRRTYSNAAGRFEVGSMAIGSYTVRCESAGFQTSEAQDVTLSIGQTLERRIVLRVSSTDARVDVNAENGRLDTTAANSSVALGGERINDSPVQQRNFLNFVLVAPGIAAAAKSNVMRSTASLRGPEEDSGFSFGGLSARNNGLYIDGLDNRDAMTGSNRIAVSPDMVQEFQVASSDIAPSSGGAAAANLNVVTLSGTNRWHGDATFFAGNQFLNARDPDVEAKVRPPYRLYEPEATLGGPLRKDRVFFYAGLEQDWESSADSPELPDGSSLEQLNTALATPAYNNSAVHHLTEFLQPTRSVSTLAFGKVDVQANERNSVFLRYAVSRGVETGDVLGSSNFADVSTRGSSKVLDQAAVLGWTTTINNDTIHQLRLQYARRDVAFAPNSSGALLEIPGVVSFGQSPQMNGANTQAYVQGMESVTLARGSHLPGFGVSVRSISLDIVQPNRFAGIYIFPTLLAFTGGQPDVYIQRFGDPHTAYSTRPVGIWAQDQWQPGHGVTITGGLRFDTQRYPVPIPPSSNQWSPRFGIAWHVGGSPWVVRASFGVYHDTLPFSYLNHAIDVDGVHAFEQYAVGASAAKVFAASQGGTPTAPVSNLMRSSYRPDVHFPATYATHLTAGFERSLDANTTISTEFLAVRGLHLPQIRNDIGALPPQYRLGQTASSKYEGVTITVNRHLADEMTYLVSYSVSRAYDDASDFNEQPTNPHLPSADWSRSDQFQSHRVAASGIFELPFDEELSAPHWLRRLSHEFDVAPSISYGSPRPLNALATTDLARLGEYPIAVRPAGLSRNPYFTRLAFELDAKISKGFTMPIDHGKLTLAVSGFNLTNHTNTLTRSPFFSSGGTTPLGTYRGLVEGLNARQLQFSLEWEF